jgi:hypothetical protein
VLWLVQPALELRFPVLVRVQRPLLWQRFGLRKPVVEIPLISRLATHDEGATVAVAMRCASSQAQAASTSSGESKPESSLRTLFARVDAGSAAISSAGYGSSEEAVCGDQAAAGC